MFKWIFNITWEKKKKILTKILKYSVAVASDFRQKQIAAQDFAFKMHQEHGVVSHSNLQTLISRMQTIANTANSMSNFFMQLKPTVDELDSKFKLVDFYQKQRKSMNIRLYTLKEMKKKHRDMMKKKVEGGDKLLDLEISSLESQLKISEDELIDAMEAFSDAARDLEDYKKLFVKQREVARGLREEILKYLAMYSSDLELLGQEVLFKDLVLKLKSKDSAMNLEKLQKWLGRFRSLV